MTKNKKIKITSLQAYERIKNSGYLCHSQMQVIHFIALFPNRSQKECIEFYDNVHLQKRYAELEKMGMIVSTGERIYKGFNRKTYDLTGNTKPENIETKKIDWKELYISIRHYLPSGIRQKTENKYFGDFEL